MGVPKLFRWLTDRYPSIKQEVSAYNIPSFDNLYLDLNGIIHQCSHGNSKTHSNFTEDEMFSHIYSYIQFLVRLVRPRRCLFIAVDGVAPRAKMNQQRGRRFRTAYERMQAMQTNSSNNDNQPTSHFDSNCITPGTPFMERLHEHLARFLTQMVSEDPLWRLFTVVYSGHNVPGEGEHKIMDYIRCQRSAPDYDRHTKHCLYGLDADLIILGLCSQELCFSLLREQILYGHEAKRKKTYIAEQMTFNLLHLNLLSDYIHLEFQSVRHDLKFEYNLQAVINDWILLSFLVGNDFVPHLPGLHINKNGFSLLYHFYKQVLPQLDGYINDSGVLHVARLRQFLVQLLEWERDRVAEEAETVEWLHSKRDETSRSGRGGLAATDRPQCQGFGILAALSNLSEKTDNRTHNTRNKSEFGFDSTANELTIGAMETDDVSLTDLQYDQYRKYYYKSKLHIDCDSEEGQITRLLTEYVRALQWVLHYYHSGVCSWSWYYPYHYAPLVFDLCRQGALEQVSLEFRIGVPFRPFEQLMSVLPPSSSQCVPRCFRHLLERADSPLAHFYPESFQTDLNGKLNDWEAVVLLPFISQEELFKHLLPLYKNLSPSERLTNQHGYAYIISLSKQEKLLIAEIPRDFFVLERSQILREKLTFDKNDLFFLSLNHVPFTTEVKEARGKYYAYSAMQLHVSTDECLRDWSPHNFPQQCEKLLRNRYVHVQWPHLCLARVKSITDGIFLYSFDKKNTLERKDLTTEERDNFNEICEMISKRYTTRFGIDLGVIRYVLNVNRIQNDSSRHKLNITSTHNNMWSSVVTHEALQCCLWREEPVSHESHFTTPSSAHLYNLHDQLFVLDPRYFGASASLITESNGGYLLSISAGSGIYDTVKYRDLQAAQETCLSHYLIDWTAAKQLYLTSHVLAMITSAVILDVSAIQSDIGSHKTDANIAIRIRNARRQTLIAGYTRFHNNRWMYSRRAIEVIRNYQLLFPEVFQCLLTAETGYRFTALQIWPESKFSSAQRNDRFSQLMRWLEAQACIVSRYKYDVRDRILEPCVVQQLEQFPAVTATTNLTTRCHLGRYIATIRPADIFHFTFGNLPHRLSTDGGGKQVKFRLFDRVVLVLPSTPVPIGSYGIVTGLRVDSESDIKEMTLVTAEETAQRAHFRFCDVLFDRPFLGATNLCGNSARSYCVPISALLNLTYARETHPSSITENDVNLSPSLSIRECSFLQIESSKSFCDCLNNLCARLMISPPLYRYSSVCLASAGHYFEANVNVANNIFCVSPLCPTLYQAVELSASTALSHMGIFSDPTRVESLSNSTIAPSRSTVYTYTETRGVTITQPVDGSPSDTCTPYKLVPSSSQFLRDLFKHTQCVVRTYTISSPLVEFIQFSTAFDFFTYLFSSY